MENLVLSIPIATLLLLLPTFTYAQGSTVVDSIVLERTLCYGTCPAYRLTLGRDGEVRFESRNPGNSGRTASDRIAAESVQSLAARAVALGFFQLPDTIQSDKRLCQDLATDHPTVTVTISVDGAAKRVIDYRGCYEASNHSVVDLVARLREFEAAIDSAAGSTRWVRPARRR